jgi:predicted dehydrogenase
MTADRRFEGVTTCDINRARADQAAAEFGVCALYALDEVRADPALRAIGLFTPHSALE